jgi:hypothetical protein
MSHPTQKIELNYLSDTFIKPVYVLSFHAVQYHKFKMTTIGAPPVAAVQLPVFDISDPTPEVGRSMIAAAAKYGFLYIDNKGIDFTEAIVDRVFGVVCTLPLRSITRLADQSALVEEFLLLARRRETRMHHWT